MCVQGCGRVRKVWRVLCVYVCVWKSVRGMHCMCVSVWRWGSGQGMIRPVTCSVGVNMYSSTLWCVRRPPSAKIKASFIRGQWCTHSNMYTEHIHAANRDNGKTMHTDGCTLNTESNSGAVPGCSLCTFSLALGVSTQSSAAAVVRGLLTYKQAQPGGWVTLWVCTPVFPVQGFGDVVRRVRPETRFVSRL